MKIFLVNGNRYQTTPPASVRTAANSFRLCAKKISIGWTSACLVLVSLKFTVGGLIGLKDAGCLVLVRYQEQRLIQNVYPFLLAGRQLSDVQGKLRSINEPESLTFVRSELFDQNWSANPARTENCEVYPDTQKKAIRGCTVSANIHFSSELCLL